MDIPNKILATSSLGMVISMTYCWCQGRQRTDNEVLDVIFGALLLVSLFFFIGSLLTIIWLL